mmetsp:Transcript_1244/g.2532  ORF Transcript_1244/g.2532 Transcript_1244/m.2532 type:complete len:226 (+) Transcript_1244:204-881(+)
MLCMGDLCCLPNNLHWCRSRNSFSSGSSSRSRSCSHRCSCIGIAIAIGIVSIAIDIHIDFDFALVVSMNSIEELVFAFLQERNPFLAVVAAGVRKGSVPANVFREQQGRIGVVYQQVHDVEIGRRRPQGVVKGIAAKVVAPIRSYLDFQQQEFHNVGVAPSTRHVHNGLAELVAGVHALSGLLQLPQQPQVVSSDGPDRLEIVGGNVFFRRFLKGQCLCCWCCWC